MLRPTPRCLITGDPTPEEDQKVPWESIVSFGSVQGKDASTKKLGGVLEDNEDMYSVIWSGMFFEIAC